MVLSDDVFSIELNLIIFDQVLKVSVGRKAMIMKLVV